MSGADCPGNMRHIARAAQAAASRSFARQGAALEMGGRITLCGFPHFPLQCGMGPFPAGMAEHGGKKWQPVGESNPSFQVENLAS